jgi:hypothetical protein
MKFSNSLQITALAFLDRFSAFVVPLTAGQRHFALGIGHFSLVIARNAQ